MKKAGKQDDVTALTRHLKLGASGYREFGQPPFTKTETELAPARSPAADRDGVPEPASTSADAAATRKVMPAPALVEPAAALAFAFERLRRKSIGAASRIGKLELGLPAREPLRQDPEILTKDRPLAELFAKIERQAGRRVA